MPDKEIADTETGARAKGRPSSGRPSRRALLTAAAGAGAAAVFWVPRAPRAQAQGAPLEEGGIGGTGAPGVTGVVGVLTDFGSLRVNGLTIETSDATEALDAFGPIPGAALALGHSLSIDAERLGAGGAFSARRALLAQPLIGRAEEISETSLRVMGVEAVLDPGAPRPPALAVGDRVAISGLWRGDRVAASRIDAARNTRFSVVAGVVSPRERDGLRRIGAVSVRMDDAEGAAAEGRYVTALGRWSPPEDRRSLRVERLVVGRFAMRPSALSVEGFLEPIAARPFFRVAGLGHSFDEDLDLRAFAARRTLFTGPYARRYAPTAATRLPEDFATRRRALAAGTLEALPIP
ncbi:MAG: DUF5666 domain-containing protein [Pseudomonadota bacterium]